MTGNDRDAYIAALHKARQAFERSTKRQQEVHIELAQLETDIANLRKTITALAAMCSLDPGIDALGITDSVMTVMFDTKYAWSTGEVVAALDGMGFDLSSQKNPQASVHAVLSRLAARGKITRVTGEDVNKDASGRPMEWRGPKYDPDDDIPF